MDAVEKRKKHVLVVYEDGHEDISSFAKAVKDGLSVRVSVQLRPASELSIPEILAADAYVFGLADSSSPFWLETKRVLQGINLAGRHGALFFKAAGDAKAFKQQCAASELGFPVKDQQLSASADASAWVESLLASF